MNMNHAQEISFRDLFLQATEELHESSKASELARDERRELKAEIHRLRREVARLTKAERHARSYRDLHKSEAEVLRMKLESCPDAVAVRLALIGVKSSSQS